MDNKEGARRGPGRPRGAATQKTRDVANKLATDGVTPLEVMIDNMRFAVRSAEEALRTLTAENQGPVIRAVLRLREMAQDAARDAAPYIHPRLASIEMRTDGEVRHIVKSAPMTAEEWADKHGAEISGSEPRRLSN